MLPLILANQELDRLVEKIIPALLKAVPVNKVKIIAEAATIYIEVSFSSDSACSISTAFNEEA